jgi:hypothetical protein
MRRFRILVPLLSGFTLAGCGGEGRNERTFADSAREPVPLLAPASWDAPRLTDAPQPPPDDATSPPPLVDDESPRGERCDPNYAPCVPIDSDVDCAGGRGNGPSYVAGPVRVIGSDPYGLDRNGDGVGCER